MDAEERLTPEELDEPTALAAHHLLRYELAAALCRGLRVLDLGCGAGYGSALLAARGAASVEGVDLDAGTIAQATRRYGSDTVSFTAADAVERLRALGAGDVDAVVTFEALEHLPDPDAAMERLATLAAEGVKVLASVPNSQMFGEENAFHVTDFDPASAAALLGRLPGVVMLHQFLAEGSLIVGAGDTYRGPVGFVERGEPEYANTFIGASGWGEAVTTEAIAHLNLVVAPNHNRYMLSLERLNRELFAANSAMGTSYTGRGEAGGASVLDRLNRLIAEQDAEIRGLRAHVAANDDRIHDLVDIAAVHKYDAIEARRELARRRYRLADRLVDTVDRLPGLKRARVLRARMTGRG